MNQSAAFYGLTSVTMNPCFLQKEARLAAMDTWACPGCGCPKSEVCSIDVALQDRSPRDKPLNFVFGSSVGLIHRELLECIDQDVIRSDLHLGRVFGRQGEELPDWVTFRGRREVIIRGSTNAGFRHCEECGRVLYSATGSRYLSPAPPADATVFERQPGALVVPQEIYERVAARNWRRLRIEKLPILDEPLDGLGMLESK